MTGSQYVYVATLLACGPLVACCILYGGFVMDALEWVPNWESHELMAYKSTETENITYQIEWCHRKVYMWVASTRKLELETGKITNWRELACDGNLVSVLEQCQLDYKQSG